MEVFGKGTPEGTRPLLPPGTCWICDMSPIQEAHRVIDTRRNARPGGATSHASVRKYICEPCALEMGGAMGMVAAERAEALETEVKQLTADNMSLTSELDAERARKVRVVTADEVVDMVSQVVRDELATKTTTRKRAAAAPADE